MSIPKNIQPGRCMFCSCTDINPCPEGCAWANRGRTICSSIRCTTRARKKGIPIKERYK
jgi:hypothetical protein